MQNLSKVSKVENEVSVCASLPRLPEITGVSGSYPHDSQRSNLQPTMIISNLSADDCRIYFEIETTFSDEEELWDISEFIIEEDDDINPPTSPTVRSKSLTTVVEEDADITSSTSATVRSKSLTTVAEEEEELSDEKSDENELEIDWDEEDREYSASFACLPAPIIPCADLINYTCCCEEHTDDTDGDADQQPVIRTYASVVGQVYGQGKTVTRITGVNNNTKKSLWLPFGEVRDCNVIVDAPEVIVYSPSKVNTYVPNDDIPVQVENACLNMSVGWKENNCWVYKNGLVRKAEGKRCRCGGIDMHKIAVLDAPCVCDKGLYHSANFKPQDVADYKLVASNGFRRRAFDAWKDIKGKPMKCGFVGRYVVDHVAKDGWILETVAINGPAGFTFASAAFEELMCLLPDFAARVGGIHPNICLDLAIMMATQGNARVLLSKMLRKQKHNVSESFLQAPLLLAFAPSPLKVVGECFGEWRKRNLPSWWNEVEAQGIVEDGLNIAQTVVEVIEEATSNACEAVLDCPLWQKIYEIFGGVGKIPRLDAEFLVMSTPNWFVGNNLGSQLQQNVMYAVLQRKIQPATRNVHRLLSIFQLIWFLLDRIANRKDQSILEVEAQGITHAAYSAIQLLLPGIDLDEDTQKKLGNELRNQAIARQTIKDYWNFVKIAMEWLLNFFHALAVKTPDEVKTWMDEVDKMDEIFMSGDSATTLKVELTKFQQQRRKLYWLMKTGKDHKKKLEAFGQNSFLLKLVNERCKKIENIVSRNTGAYVGSEGKLKPHVIYFWGDSKAGKTSLIDHFYSDVFDVLGEDPYNPGVDRYTVNPLDEFFDSYKYNRVVDYQDFFQLTDPEARNQEIYSLIHWGDEGPAPLKIAECSGKGAVYFCSEHLALTSNFDLSHREKDIVSLVESYEAVRRRIDLYVHVHRNTNVVTNTYDRSQMRFEVDGEMYDWYEFVELAAKSILANRAKSMGTTSLEKTEEIKKRLELIKNTVNAQGFKDRVKEKIEELRQLYTVPWTIKTGLKLGSAFGLGYISGRYRIACAIAEWQDRFINTASIVAKFLVNWSEIILLVGGATVLIYKLWPQKPSWVSIGEGEAEGMVARSGAEPVIQVRKKNPRSVRSEGQSTHHHKCTWCGKTYVHDHDYNYANHAQFKYQCPNIHCESYYGKGKKGLNITNSVLVGEDRNDGEGAVVRYTRCDSANCVKLHEHRFIAGKWEALDSRCISVENEGMVARSGAEPLVQVRRAPQKAKKLIAEGALAPNMAQVRQLTMRNLGMVRGGRAATHCFGLFERVVAIPQHVFMDVYGDRLLFTVYSNVSFEVNMKEVKPSDVKLMPELHMVFLNLRDYLNAYPSFSDITRRVVECADAVTYSNGVMFTTRADERTKAECWAIPIEDLKLTVGRTRIMIRNEEFFMDTGVRGFGKSENGDCGSPWIMDTPIGALIVGLHVGGNSSYVMTGSLITKELLMSLKKCFGSKADQPVNVLPQGSMFDPPDYVKGVEVLGITTDVNMHMPRKTKLVESPFYGIRDPLTAPARLSRFVVPGDEKCEKISPLLLNFKKNYVNKKHIPIRTMKKATELLKDWYFPHGKSRTERRVLTLDEAVFGDPNDWRNKSVNPNTSVGWPWCERYSSRKALIDLQERTIHPELRSSCDTLLDDIHGTETFLFLDMLKDERLPLEKVEAGKTRVFTILPIHVNLVLKQLFGHFVMFLQEKKDVAPVKLGISQTPEDWGLLFKFLQNGGKFIAGDYSAFDKNLHYELMKAVLDMVSDFYDDEFDAIRESLLDRVFCGYRLIDGVVYQTFGGMPSGCYLTAAFNSLCNVMYWFCFLVESGEDLIDHLEWFRPAVFGDDHLIAVCDHPEINQRTFAVWLGNLGLAYTTASKGAVNDEYTEEVDISFLKRGFRWEGGYCWAPMPENVIMDMIQWYRRTAFTAGMSRKDLVHSLVSELELEAVHYGKKDYDRLLDELQTYVPYDLTVVRKSYEKTRAIFLAPQFDIQLLSMNANIMEFPLSQDEVSCEIFIEKDDDTQKSDTIHVKAQGDEVDSATYLGETNTEEKVQGLTLFTDQTQADTQVVSRDVCQAVDTLFELPKGFFDMCSRWLNVGRFILPSGTPSGYPILRIDPMNFLVSDPYIQSKIQSTTFLRYTMEVQLKLVSTKFHYGAFMVVWRPNFAAGLGRYAWGKNTADSSLVCCGLDADQNPYGPYDNVHTASQSEHVILSTTARNSIRLEIPWTLPFQYVPTPKMTLPRYHPGWLDIYALTPIGPSEIDAPEMAILASFVELRGWGYKAQGTPPQKLIYISDKKQNTKDGSLWKVPKPNGPNPGNDPTVGGATWTYMLTGYQLTVDAEGINTKQETDAQVGGSWLLESAHWLLDTAKSAVSLFAPLGPLMGFFGLSRPADATPVQRMLLSNIPMSNGLGPDPCYSSAINPYNLCDVDDSPQEKTISSLAGIPTYMGYFTFTPSDTKRKVITLSPDFVKEMGEYKVCTPAAFIISQFRYWRSSIKLKFCFYSSSFVSLRVALYVTYGGVDGQIGLVPTKVIDIAGDAECDIDIPFLKETPWFDTLEDASPMFNLVVEPITDIVSDEAATGAKKPVYCAVWASFPTLQVSGFVPRLFGDTSYVLLASAGERVEAQGIAVEAQGSELPGLTNVDNANQVHWGMNDIPGSIYHIAKRYNTTYSQQKLRPWNCPLRFGKTSEGSKKVVSYNDCPAYIHYACLFRYYRTSVNVISKAVALNEAPHAYGEHYRDGASKSDWSYTGAFNFGVVGTTNMRVPFRSSVSFLPTPISTFDYGLTFTAAEGGGYTAAITGGGWSNPYHTSIYGQKLGTGGVNTIGKSPLYAAAADDLVYKYFIGVPTCRLVTVELLDSHL